MRLISYSNETMSESSLMLISWCLYRQCFSRFSYEVNLFASISFFAGLVLPASTPPLFLLSSHVAITRVQMLFGQSVLLNLPCPVGDMKKRCGEKERVCEKPTLVVKVNRAEFGKSEWSE